MLYKLGDKIEQNFHHGDNKPFPAKDIQKVSYEVAKGLEYLHHKAHILHGDIKSANILVAHDFSVVKLCDFGHSLPLTESLEIDTSKGNFSYVGTCCWNAPEIIYGTIIFVLVTQQNNNFYNNNNNLF